MVEFEKIEDLKFHVGFNELKNIPELKDAEPFKNNQGSLFKLSEDEYETIRTIIDRKNLPQVISKLEKYSKKDALEEIFIEPMDLNEILDILEHKKNIILQGPPGVGKTFIAKKIAYALMGKKDNSKIIMIQFHQSYSYEDFIQGYRPNNEGKFDLKYGIFYDFCRMAINDEDNKYFFIIDEINRGNLSKIFGELMMLIESDKRGSDFAVPLTYSETGDDKFYIPENIYLIGTMNTADRSLALVDYALRRRFSFIGLSPKFENNKFQEHLKAKGVTNVIINKIVQKMTDLNVKIANDKKNLGRGFVIGHSYFCPLEETILDSNNWYRKVIKSEIAPLMREYWFDDEDQAEKIISDLLE